ncbi:hypothetical protein P1X14_16675 [Sphingomonas sp. AOB5]|uniref:hypothetical protein n=1 Tax=Sphingomonas sp. AOB5 TaxID=3034017 RepID=UPI0023F673D5|nr:hypothetical protein [Sphingomonas sp. AOB5]MDF7776894.1 hypothetical protein [Sphingomonas sp. AOB5]
MTDPRFLRTGDVHFAMAHAAEEAGEMLAALGKSLRWGLESVNPLLPPAEQETNREWLEREIGDLRGALDRLDAELAAYGQETPA